MSYRIPDDDTLADAVYMVLHRHSPIRSQNLLGELVSKELVREDPSYRVSGERARRMAIERDLATVEISYNETDRDDIPEDCPVCSDRLQTVRNSTLTGEDVVIGHRCRRCGYSIGIRMRTPGMYVFHRKR